MTTSEANREMKPAVILVGSDKGGVGKTTVTRTLLDYYETRKVPTSAYDTEAPRGTLKRFHPDVTEIVDITSIPDQMRVFNSLKASDVTLIDIRAGLLSPTLSALRDIGFIDAARKGQITLGVFHILGPSISSLNEIGEIGAFVEGTNYFIVKNMINNTAFFEWDPGTYEFLFQEDEARPADNDPASQRDGLRAGRGCVRSVHYLRGQQEAGWRSGLVFLRPARLRAALAQ